jgi:hypothetical protein
MKTAIMAADWSAVYNGTNEKDSLEYGMHLYSFLWFPGLSSHLVWWCRTSKKKKLVKSVFAAR